MNRTRRSVPWLLVLTLLGIGAQFAPWRPAWADAAYLEGTLPVWSRVTSTLIAAVPGSVSAAAVLLALVALVVALVSGRRAAGRGLKALAWCLVVLLLTFPLAFGLGYHTTALEERLGLATPAAGSAAPGNEDMAVTSIAAEAVLGVLTESAGSLAALQLSPASATQEPVAAASRCLSAYLPTVRDGPLPSLPERVRSLPQGWLLRFGFAGVVSPWLLEPHVDSGLPAAAGLAVALHELAHTAGFAREAEAEAVALLAGMRCSDPRVRYAASLKAADTFARLLTPLARESYLARWPAAASADTAAAEAAARTFLSPAAADLAARAYDTYLGSQGTAGGIDDYGRAATIVAAVIARDGAPTVAE